MTFQAIARRYAAALFDVISRTGDGDIDRAGRDLASIRELLTANPALRKVLESPGVPAQKKHAILEAVLDRSGDLGPEVRRLLLLLAERDRLVILGDVSTFFSERVMRRNRVVQADIVTAVPLGDDRRAALTTALGQATGGAVLLTERVDPSIIGGLVAKVGGVVYDGSVTRQLERMRERFLADV
jgi:F-type H+-transporting ATPase subunit delta